MTVLSERQMQVLWLIASGFRDREIADVLKIKPSTVYTYSERVRSQLGAINRPHMVFLATQKNLFSDRLAQGLAHARS